MFTVKFCNKCHNQLTDNFYCPTCEKHCNNYRAEEIEKRNNKPWHLDQWVNLHGTIMVRRYYCHSCKYFMFHPTHFCNICGGKMSGENLLQKEHVERYKDYKMGY